MHHEYATTFSVRNSDGFGGYRDKENEMEFNAADFMRWLDGKAPDERVGTGLAMGECPVAAWLNETQPQETPWWVGGTSMGYDRYHYGEHPYWVRAFTRRIDWEHVYWPVTAREAKEALEEVLG